MDLRIVYNMQCFNLHATQHSCIILTVLGAAVNLDILGWMWATFASVWTDVSRDDWT